jgi:hypothetical protein
MTILRVILIEVDQESPFFFFFFFFFFLKNRSFPSEEAEQQTGKSINLFEDSQYTIWQKLQQQKKQQQLHFSSQQLDQEKEHQIDGMSFSQPVNNTFSHIPQPSISSCSSQLVRKRKSEVTAVENEGLSSSSSSSETQTKKKFRVEHTNHEELNHDDNKEHFDHTTTDITLELSQEIDWGLEDFEKNKERKYFF